MRLSELERADRLRLLKFVCAFAWADLEVHPEERAFALRLVRRLGLDEAEERQVTGWLEVPPPPESVDPTDIPAEHLVNGGGDAANGAELFRINCAMCHNVAGAGGALTEGKFAPPLTDVSGVHIYEAMVTGPQNMPVFNDLNITPEDKRDIITYLQYVQDNRSPGGFELGSLGPVAEGLFIWIFGLGSIVAITVWITAKSN